MHVGHTLLRWAYPSLSLLLVFLGPLFFFFVVDFLRKLDYVAALLSFFAGWCLLRAGVDLARASLITLGSPLSRASQRKPQENEESEN